MMNSENSSKNQRSSLVPAFLLRLTPPSRYARSVRRLISGSMMLAVVLVVAGAVGRDSNPIELDLHTVAPELFRIQMSTTGRVEPLRSHRVNSECTWSSRILSLVPEGTWVQKGDVVCVLDSSDLLEYLRAREIPLIRARGTLDASVQDEELLKSANERRISRAEFAYQTAVNEMEQYQFGTQPERVRQMEQDLKLLHDQLLLAEEEFHNTERLWSLGFSNQWALDQARYTLSQRQEAVRKLNGDLSLMNRFSHPRTNLNLEFSRNDAERQVLRTDIANSLAETKARLETLSNERRMQILQRQVDTVKKNIEACTIRAPRDGQVLYSNSWSDLSRGRRSIEEGKTVYFRQSIFEIPDHRFQKVSVAIHESLISRVHRGMKVDVRLKGFESQEIAGEIIRISDYPRTRSQYNPEQLEYWMEIQLQPDSEQLEIIRMNMDATVTLTLMERNEALLIPRNAVVSSTGVSLVWLMQDKDLVVRRVQLGEANDKMVCVTGGLEQGERIATNLTPQQIAALQKELEEQLSVASL